MSIDTPCSKCGRPIHLELAMSGDRELDRSLLFFAKAAVCGACGQRDARPPKPKPVQREIRTPYRDD